MALGLNQTFNKVFLRKENNKISDALKLFEASKKEWCDQLEYSLTLRALFNKSLTQEKVPDPWKKAKITPVFNTTR